MSDEKTLVIEKPVVPPLGIEVTRDAIIEAWDGITSDEGIPLSVEERVIFGVLNSVYRALPPTEKHP